MYDEKRLPLKFYVYADYNKQIAKQKYIVGEPFKQISHINEIDLPYGTIDYIVNILNSEKAKYKLIILDDKQTSEVIDSLIKQNIK